MNTKEFLESFENNIFVPIKRNSKFSDTFLEKFKDLDKGILDKIGISKIDTNNLSFNKNISNTSISLDDSEINKINRALIDFYKEIHNEPAVDDNIKKNTESFLSEFGNERIKLELQQTDIGPVLTQLQNVTDSDLKKNFFSQINSERPTDDLCEKLGMEIKDSDSEVLFNNHIDPNSLTKDELEKFNKILLKFYVVMNHDSENKDIIVKTVGDYILKYGNNEQKTEVIISRDEDIKKINEGKFFQDKNKNESYVGFIKRIANSKLQTRDKSNNYMENDFYNNLNKIKKILIENHKLESTVLNSIFSVNNNSVLDKAKFYDQILTSTKIDDKTLTDKKLITPPVGSVSTKLKDPPTGDPADGSGGGDPTAAKKSSIPTTGTSDPTAKSTTIPPADTKSSTSPVIGSLVNFGVKPNSQPSNKSPYTKKYFGAKPNSDSTSKILKKSPLNFGVKPANSSNQFGTGTFSSGSPFGFVDLDSELPDALNKLYDLYIDFALAKSQPYNVYLYNKEHILAKQTELVNNIYAYCKSSGTNIGNQLVNLSNTLQSISTINNEDLNVIIESIKKNDFVRIYDALSHICMDGARDRVQNFIDGNVNKIGTGDTELVDLQNIDRASFDKGFSEHKEETLNNLATTCGKIIGNNNNFNSNDLNQLQNFKNETGVDYKEYPDVINHLARAGRVAENNLSNKNLTTNCADAWKGVPYSEASDNYVECVKNYNQYIMFDNIGHISFEINGCTLKLNLTDEQKNKFDMLELGKYTGRSIGLVPGIVGYLSSHPEIGIDVNNINKCISISKNGRELTTQEEKNNVIMKEFVSDGFKSKISNVNFNQSLDSVASSLESRVISRDKSTAGKMLLSCFGENNQKVSPQFVDTIKAQTQANTKGRGINIQ